MEKLLKENKGAASGSDWYRDADPDDRREYDEFGPWILSIRSEDDMPRRFRGWYQAHSGAKHLLKVPRDVDRRAVRPGDDLYRAVVAVHEDHLCCLTLADGAVVEQTIRMDEIEAIHHSEILLWGQLRLWLLGGGEWALDYNTVSAASIVPMIDFLRKNLSTPHRVVAGPPILVQDYFFSVLAGDHLRRVSENHVVFCEDPQPMPNEVTRRGRYTGGLLVLDSGTELTFVTQGAVSRRASRSRLGHHCLHLPKRFLAGAELTDKTEKGGFSGRTLDLRTRDGRSVEFLLARDGRAILDYLLAAIR